MWRGNGTTANVGLVIYGSNGSTGDISLTDPQLEKVFFARGSITISRCACKSLWVQSREFVSGTTTAGEILPGF